MTFRAFPFAAAGLVLLAAPVQAASLEHMLRAEIVLRTCKFERDISDIDKLAAAIEKRVSDANDSAERIERYADPLTAEAAVSPARFCARYAEAARRLLDQL